MKDGPKFIAGKSLKGLKNIGVTAAVLQAPEGEQLMAVLELTLGNGPGRPPEIVRCTVHPRELALIGQHLIQRGSELHAKTTPPPGSPH